MAEQGPPPQPFDQSSVYDVPTTLASMLMQDEFTPRGAMNALFRPERLSPSERYTMVSRLKDAAGRHPLSDAFIDIATNPWTWVMLLTSPVGGKAVGSLYDIAPGAFKTLRNNPTVTQAFGALTGAQQLRGTPTAEAAYAHSAATHRMMSLDSVQQALHFEAQAAKDLGLSGPGLDPSRYKVGTESHAKAVEASTAIHNYLTRSWEDVATMRNRPAADGVPYREAATDAAGNPKSTPAYTTEAGVMAEMNRLGLRPLADAHRSAYNQIRDTLYPDADAVIRMSLGVSKGAGEDITASGASLAGIGIHQSIRSTIENLVPKDPSLLGRLRTGIDESVLKGIREDTRYVPRNISQKYVNGEVQPYDPTARISPDQIRAVSPGAETYARRETNVIVDPAHLKASMRMGGTPALQAEIDRVEAIMADAKADGRELRVFQMSPVQSFHRYVQQAGIDHSLFVEKITAAERATLGKTLDIGGLPTGKVRLSTTEAGKEGPLIHEDWTAAEPPVGDYRRADLIARDFLTTPNQHTRDYIEHVALPHMMSRVQSNHTVILAALNTAQRTVSAFLSTGVGESLKRAGGLAEKFHDWMQTYADRKLTNLDASQSSHAMAGWLYTSHLGAPNLVPGIVNLTQPFGGGLAAAIGSKHVIAAYGPALQEVLEYARDRVATYGARVMTEAQRTQLMKKHLKYTNWGPDSMDLLDVAAHGVGRYEGSTLEQIAGASLAPSHKKQLEEILLAPFGLTELVNRNVTAHAVHAFKDAQAARLGRTFTEAEIGSDIHQTVREFMFGGHWMNSPEMFLPRSPGGQTTIPAGGLFQNPLTRQFLTYPVRLLTTHLHTVPYMAGQDAYWTSLARQSARAMGISAVMYHVGKDLLGTELGERAGFYAGATQLVPFMSNGRYDERQGPFPLPPALDIPLGVFQSVLAQDSAMLGRSLARLVPGGVGIAKAIGAAPRLPAGAIGLQRTYADWNNPQPDGTIPLHMADGRLLGFESPSMLVAHAVGIDLDRFSQAGQLDRFLAGNRDEIMQYRQEYVRKLLGNDTDGAQAVSSEFRKRFGVGLTVTQAQLKQAQTIAETPRTDRALNSMPASVRPQYQAIVQASGRQMPQQRTPTTRVDPQTQRFIEEEIAKQVQEKAESQPEYGFSAPRAPVGY